MASKKVHDRSHASRNMTLECVEFLAAFFPWKQTGGLREVFGHISLLPNFTMPFLFLSFLVIGLIANNLDFDFFF